MGRSVLVIDNNPVTRGRLCIEIEKSPYMEVLASSGMGRDALSGIRTMGPEIVVINMLAAEYEAGKAYTQRLMEDATVRFLTLSRHEKRYFVLALFGSPPADGEAEGKMLEHLFSAGEKIGIAESVDGHVGRYILKGVSLRCA
jgi:chemotaxis response regulator CheB